MDEEIGLVLEDFEVGEVAFLFVIDGADALAGHDGSGNSRDLAGEGGCFESAGEGVGDVLVGIVGADFDFVASSGEEVFEGDLSGVVLRGADFEDGGGVEFFLLFVGETEAHGEEAIGTGSGLGLRDGVAVFDGGEAGPDHGGVLGDFANFDSGAEKGGGAEKKRGGEKEQG